MNVVWSRIVFGCIWLLAFLLSGAAVQRLLETLDDPLGWAQVALAWLLLTAARQWTQASHVWNVLSLTLALVLVALSLFHLGSWWFAGPGALLSLAALVGGWMAYLTRDKTAAVSLADFYSAAVKARRIRASEEQLQVVAVLDTLVAEFSRFDARRHWPWAFLLTAPQGVYLHGPVGRGKSFLLDGMFDLVPSAHKRRLHFHELVAQVNEARNAKKPMGDKQIARQLAPRGALILIDEVNLLDLATAMSLLSLTRALWARGCVLCMSANQPPSEMLAGVQAAQLDVTSFVDLLQQRCRVLSMTAGEDYRLQKLSGADLYQHPVGPGTEARLHDIVTLLSETQPQRQPLCLQGRRIEVRLRALGVVWFDFAALCESPLAYQDYLAIAKEFPNIVVSAVPALSSDLEDAARRFAWLVEIVYDTKQRLILSAAVPLKQLFAPDLSFRGVASDYEKIASRLAEMQSSEYHYSLGAETKTASEEAAG